jgi:fucose permease
MIETPAPNLTNRRLYAACLVSMVAFSASVTTPAICLQQIGDDFHLSLAARGFLGSARMGALLVGLLVTGYLADVFGKGFFLTAGMLLISLGMAGLSVAGGFGGLVAASMLGGSGTGGLEALVNPLVADLRPVQTARYLNLANGVYSLGLVAAALLTGELLYAHVSWRTTMLLWIAPAVVGAALFATRGYPRIEHHAEGTAPHRFAFLRRPLFWTLVGAIFLGGGAEAGMTFWGSSFTQSELGASARSGAWCLAFFGLFMAIGRFASGWLVSRIAPVRLMTLSAALCAVATAGLWGVQTIVGAWALFGLGGLFVACFWPTLLAVAAEDVQVGSASMFSLLAASGIGGCVLFPWGIGAVGDLAGLRAGTLLLPASMVLLVVLLLVAWRQVKAHPAATPAP